MSDKLILTRRHLPNEHDSAGNNARRSASTVLFLSYFGNFRKIFKESNTGVKAARPLHQSATTGQNPRLTPCMAIV